MKKQHTPPLLILLWICIAQPLIAQEKNEPLASVSTGTLKGQTIETATQSALELATISIFQQSDSSLVAGTLSKKNGKFSISLPYGVYFAKIQFIGLAAKTIDSLRIDQEHPIVDMGEINLDYQTEYLNEVHITGARSGVQISLDKRIYNVSKDPSTAGGSALEVLDNLPAVSVEPQGAVSLRGSRGVQLLIDGKPSALVSNGNTTGLQSLPADLIERVEVITNPSVKYEAEGTAGIINIVLKKEKKKGLNGAANLTAGHPSLFNTALNLNLKKNIYHLYGNFSFSDNRTYGIGSARQEARLDNGSTEIFNSSSIYNTGGPAGTFRIGSDIHFPKNLIVTTSLVYALGKEDNYSENIYDNFLNNLENYTGGSTRIENRVLHTDRQEYAATLHKIVEQNKQEITADIRFQKNSDVANSEFTETFLLRDRLSPQREDLLQQSSYQQAEHRLIAKWDYLLPLREENQFETGWQSSWRGLTNDYDFEEYLQSTWVISEDFTNTFQYEEQIHAVYGMYKNTLHAVSFQLGLRSEYSHIETSSAHPNTQTYLNFFPSLHLSHEFPRQNTLQISYTRRIRRPRSMSLNPFIALDDNRAFFSGNPNLTPEITDTFELGHVKKWEKGTIGSFIFYRYTTDVIEGVVKEVELSDGVPVFYRQPENLTFKEDVGLEFNLSYDPAPWWSITSDFFLYRAVIDGTNINDEIQTETYTGFGRISSKLTLFKDMNFQLRLNYSAPRNIPQGRRQSMTFLNASMSKNVWEDRVKISLNIADLFQSRRIRNFFMTERLFRENDYRWSRRMIRFTLTYRIKK